MKLLMCDSCFDVFKLAIGEVRQCSCGKCKGKYDDDGHRASTNGEGMCIALDNNTILPHLRQLDRINASLSAEYGSLPITAWVRPHTGAGNPRSSIDVDLEIE